MSKSDSQVRDIVIVGTSIVLVVGCIFWMRNSLNEQTRYQVETASVTRDTEELNEQIESFESEIPSVNEKLDQVEVRIEQLIKSRKLADGQLVELMARYQELQTERKKANELSERVKSMLDNTLYLLEQLAGERPAA